MGGNPLPWKEIESAIRHFGEQQASPMESGIYYGTIKLDGTNLGIDIEGRIFGRRHPVTGDKHCGTSLSHLRQPEVRDQIRKVRALVARDFGSQNPHCLDATTLFIVYGEFGIQRQTRYRCTASNYGQWSCFGIRFRFPSGHSFGSALREMEIRSDLRERGHRFQREVDDGDQITYTLLMTPRLLEIFHACQLKGVEIKFTGPLRDWLGQAAEWLVEKKEEEGLVIVTPQSLLLKWKCPLELQPKFDLKKVSTSSSGTGTILRTLVRVIPPETPTSLVDPRQRNHRVMHSALSKFNLSDWKLEFSRIHDSADDTHSRDQRIKSYLKYLQEQLHRECLEEFRQLDISVDDKTLKLLNKMSQGNVSRVYSIWQTNKSQK